MKKVLDSGLLVRRINLRQVMVMPCTRMESYGDHLVRKHHSLFVRHKIRMRAEIDEPMLKKVLPPWTVMKDVRTELHQGNMTWSRQIGSYPILVGIPEAAETGKFVDVVVLSHGPRSVGALELPLKINSMTMRQLEVIPGIGAKRAAAIVRARPLKNYGDLYLVLGDPQVAGQIKPFLDFT
jgi:radical SAM superfamily enzyme with C-terminal helix-hairpin-helix motif